MSDVTFRDARREDVPAIVALLADDDINGYRERVVDPLPEPYFAAFEAIEADGNNRLFVGEKDGAVVATAQVTFVPTMIAQGATRAIVESVRVSSTVRSQGVGEKLLRFCEGVAREHGCPALQLTTTIARANAQRFYERIGYELTHKGYRRML